MSDLYGLDYYYDLHPQDCTRVAHVIKKEREEKEYDNKENMAATNNKKRKIEEDLKPAAVSKSVACPTLSYCKSVQTFLTKTNGHQR